MIAVLGERIPVESRGTGLDQVVAVVTQQELATVGVWSVLSLACALTAVLQARDVDHRVNRRLAEGMTLWEYRDIF